MKVTPKFDRREEGLRELASMIADAYRKGKTLHHDEEPLVSDDEIIPGVEQDGENGFRYTETVRVEAILRRTHRSRRNPLK